MTERSTPAVIVAAGGWHDETPGGAYRLATDFARFLAARGRSVHYVCPSPTARSRTRDLVGGVELHRYPAPDSPSPSLRNVRDHVAQARDIAHAIADRQPVAALLGHSQLQYLGASAACGAGTRRTFAVHSPFALELREHSGASPTILQRLSWHAAGWMERRIVRTADRIHCDSAFTRGLMLDAYGDAVACKTIVLPGWADCTAFTLPRVPRDVVRRQLGAPWTPGAPTFLSLRRLVPRMGIDVLIESTAILAAQGCRFHVVIAGDGPARADLESLVAARRLGHRISFIGRVPQEQIADVYRAADCFVLPTKALECFGLIVIESFACGTPVIGVPVGAIPEVMGASFSSWIAATNDAPSIAARMQGVLDGTLTSDSVRLRARALEFDADRVMAQHERELLGAGTVVRDEVA